MLGSVRNFFPTIYNEKQGDDRSYKNDDIYINCKSTN